MGFPTPNEACEDVHAARRQRLITQGVTRQTRPSYRDKGCGLESAVNTGGAGYVDGEALVLARALTASSGMNPSRSFEELPNLPVAKVLAQKLKEVTSYAKGALVHTVGISWVAVVLRKDPINGAQETLLVEVGVA